MAILVKIFENLNFGEIFGQYFRKIAILVKICLNLDFGQNLGKKFRKMAILVKICKNFNFGKNFREISILFETFRFWSKFSK